jgi:drug/metabolite transporter (DMT)-like permease
MIQAEIEELVPANSVARPSGDVPGSRPIKGAAAALLGATLMAGYVVLGKLFLGTADHGGGPGVFLICRQLIAAVLLALVALMMHGPRLPLPEHYRGFWFLGFLHFLNALGFIWGMKCTTAFITSVMQLSIPVFTMTVAACSGQEQVGARKAFGVLVLVLGCALVTVGAYGAAGAAPSGRGPRASHWRHKLQLLFGLCILVLQCGSFVGVLLVQQRLVRHYPVAWVVAWAASACAMWSCLGALLDGSFLRLGEAVSSAGGVAIILYSATFGCVAYFGLIAFASKHISAVLVSVTVALEPLLVSLIGILAFAYQPTRLEFCGYAIALAGTASLAQTMRDEQRRDEGESVNPLLGGDTRQQAASLPIPQSISVATSLDEANDVPPQNGGRLSPLQAEEGRAKM